MKRGKIFVGGVLIALICISLWFYQRVIYVAPDVPEFVINDVIQISDDRYVLGNNWLYKGPNGNWVSYIEGDAYERGLIMGKLHKALNIKQEEIFVAEIYNNLPNWFKRNLLLLGVAWFNRDLDQLIIPEYRQEIFGISQYFSEDFDHIGPKYNRLINYHAAHDIGHAVQNMRFVGCTAFGKWHFSDSTNEMMLGRNFDFYFGEDFAKEKLILLMNPKNGYRFLSVTWGGFIGVVSGMNEHGLGITLNSAKSEIPTNSGTPVSLIAREILQYATTIDEAHEIAKKYASFVSESFTISSAKDKMIAVIEKTPETTDIYYPDDNQIIVTNHFQSEGLSSTPINIQHMENSESVDRFRRTAELLTAEIKCTPIDFARILRDQKGVGNQDIGTSNPKAINQLLAHHAIIFDNIKKIVWVSTYPFQENSFQAFDLDHFEMWSKNFDGEASIDSLQLPPDPFFKSSDYERFELYKSMQKTLQNKTQFSEDLAEDFALKFIKTNPEYYQTYRLLADYYNTIGESKRALELYDLALTKDIPYTEDRDYIIGQIDEINE